MAMNAFVAVALSLCGPPCDACRTDGAEACNCNMTIAERDAAGARAFPWRTVVGFEHTGPGLLGFYVLNCGHTFQGLRGGAGVTKKRRATCFECGLLAKDQPRADDDREHEPAGK